MEKKYEDMKLDELVKVKADTEQQIRSLRSTQHEIKLVLDKRQSEVRMKQLADGLSSNDRAALSQTLSPKGIATKTGIGKAKV